MLLTTGNLTNILHPVSMTHIEIKVDSINKTIAKYDINTYLRICHYLAQVLHESGGFFYKEEIWGNTTAQLNYDIRVDLGNTPERDGDGKLYKGRGDIQVTGKGNYRLVSNDLGVDFVKNPQLLATEPYCTLSGGWYWNKHNLNILADKDDIITITKRVNGGLNGIESRKEWLAKCKKELA